MLKPLAFVTPLFALLLVPGLFACTEDEADDEGVAEETGEGDGDGDPTGDGDGDPTTGDGDGDPTTGDGDGDPTTGDGDGDPTTGDGDGDGDACATDPGWGSPTVGTPAKHIQGFDQTGAEFNMCKYAGTPIIVDVAAVWCGPCNDVSQYFASGGTDPFGGGVGAQLSAMINEDKVIWMTTLVEDSNSAPATVANATAWDQQYPNAKIPVVVEGDIQMLPSYFQLQCWPSAFTIDHEMNWMGFDDCQTWNQLVAVINAYGG